MPLTDIAQLSCFEQPDQKIVEKYFIVIYCSW